MIVCCIVTKAFCSIMQACQTPRPELSVWCHSFTLCRLSTSRLPSFSSNTSEGMANYWSLRTNTTHLSLAIVSLAIVSLAIVCCLTFPSLFLPPLLPLSFLLLLPLSFPFPLQLSFPSPLLCLLLPPSSSLSFNYMYHSFTTPFSLSLSSTPPSLFQPHRVGANAKENKMTLTNLATVFGPNLLHPGISEPAHLNMMAMDVVTPVSVVLYYLNCPDEFFDEIQTASPENTANPSGGSGGRRNSEVVGEAAIRDETGDATPRVVLREKTRDADGDLPASQKGFRRSRRSSARGTPRNSGTNVNVRAVASFRASPSSSSVRSSTPSRESII